MRNKPAPSPASQRLQQVKQIALIDRAQHGAHQRLVHLAGRIGDGLIHQAQCIAHAALCGTRHQVQRPHLERDVLLAQHVLQMGQDQRRRQLLEIELQAARQHGDRDLLRVGGSKDELHMRRRLFQCLQHRVEGRLRQHVHFVDDVHLETPAGRRIQRAFQQLAHVVDLRVRRRIQLDQVDEAPAVDLGAGTAHAARRGRDAGFAIQGFGEDARDGGLAHAARAGEEIGMVQAVLRERVGQRLHDMLLPRQLGKVPRTPFAR